MALTDEQKGLLSAKLSPSAVKQRTQSGRSLSYIEGWHAIAEANRIFGFDGWTRETVDIRLISERERTIGKDAYKKQGWGVTYVAKVRVTVGGIVREGVGSGHGIDADLGAAHESAAKEAETDAMKRALMTFGNPFGLALYDKTQANVGDDEAEQPKQMSAYAARKEGGYERIVTAMRACVSLQDLASLWKSENAAISALPDKWQEHLMDEKERLKGELSARVAA